MKTTPFSTKSDKFTALSRKFAPFFDKFKTLRSAEKNINLLKIKGLWESGAPGGGISQGRGICAHLPATALPAR